MGTHNAENLHREINKELDELKNNLQTKGADLASGTNSAEAVAGMCNSIDSLQRYIFKQIYQSDYSSQQQLDTEADTRPSIAPGA